MDLREATASGVVVEFRDVLGNSAGTAVFFDWSGRPLPAVGDHFTCRVEPSRSGRRTLSGYVKFRGFDVQTAEDGRPAVWVRLVIELGAVAQKNRVLPGRVCFSKN